MLTVAVLRQKGGSGKDTLAVNFATAAHLEGRRTLVVDMDRQASAFGSAARQEASSLDRVAVVQVDKAIALPRFTEIARGYDYVLTTRSSTGRRGSATSRESAAVPADVPVLSIQPGPFDFWAVAETLESFDRGEPDPRAARATTDPARVRDQAPLARSERWQAWVSVSKSQAASEARSVRGRRRRSSARGRSASSRTCLSTSIGRSE